MYHGAAASFWFLRAGASVGIVCSRSLVRSFVPTAHLGVPSLLLLLQVTGEPLVRRPDDTAEALNRRLRAYHQQTSPVCGYYRQRGIHVSLDADRSPQHVYGQIIGVFRNSPDL